MILHTINTLFETRPAHLPSVHNKTSMRRIHSRSVMGIYIQDSRSARVVVVDHEIQGTVALACRCRVDVDVDKDIVAVHIFT